MKPDTLSRYRGCLLGLAVGDALGAPVEFSSPGTFAPVHDMLGGGYFGLEPGQWTDDTAMALCLAESLIERGSFDPLDQMNRYVRWLRDGHLSSTGKCFGIGRTVFDALSRFQETGNPFSGPSDPMTAGNGCIMRLAPVPLFFRRNPTEAMEEAGQSSRTTHGAATCVDACRYFGGLLVGAASGTPKEQLLSDRYSPVPGYWEQNRLTPEIDEIAAGSFKLGEPPQIKGTGYVVRSLEAALWAFYKTDSFKEGVLRAVNLGDDADTTAAVYGQIAGAHYGEEGIPEAWRTKLALRETIEAFANRLFKLSLRTTGE